MHQWQEGVSAYLRAKAPTKSQKNQERIIRHRLKKNPAGLNAYLRICIFLKEITTLVILLLAPLHTDTEICR
jgi:hypothetical protein